MVSGIKIFVVIASFLALSLSPAQSRELLDVPASARWKHAATGVILNPVMAGLNRTEMAVTAPMELDVQAQYQIASGTTFATVFVFRPAAGDLALWFDRATATIAASDRWVIESTLQSGVVPLPTGDVGGSLQAVYAVSAGNFRSTAVLLVPMGDWIVKIRMSSETLAAPDLKESLEAFARQIGWPDSTRKAEAVTPVMGCTERLLFGSKAKVASKDRDDVMVDALISAALSNIEPDKLPVKDSARGTWCRNSVIGKHGTYRSSDASNDSYLLALSDAGRAISVHPAHDLLNKGEKGKQAYAVTLHQLERIFHYQDYDRLVPPEQALNIIEKGKPVSSVSTTGDSRSITLGTNDGNR